MPLGINGAEVAAAKHKHRPSTHPQGVLLGFSLPYQVGPPGPRAVLSCYDRYEQPSSAERYRATRLKREIVKIHLCVLTRFPKARDKNKTETFAPHHPAPGYRDFGRTGYEGVARYIGDNGYSWSCTPVAGDVTARYLAFYTQSLYPSLAHNRGHGFQLRCLSE